MRVPVILMVGLAGTLALVGCGTERESQAVTEESVVATYAAAESTADLPAFTLAVTGDAIVEMPPGEIAYREVPAASNDGTEVPPYRVIVMSSESEGRRYELTLSFASDLDTGTHPITFGRYDAGFAPVGAALVDYPVGGDPDSSDAVQFDDAVEGSLTLDAVRSSVTGSFEFSAEATRTVDGVETLLVVTAAGTFDDVEMADDLPPEAADAATDEPATEPPAGEATEAAV